MLIVYILEFPSEIVAPKKYTSSKKVADPRKIVISEEEFSKSFTKPPCHPTGHRRTALLPAMVPATHVPYFIQVSTSQS